MGNVLGKKSRRKSKDLPDNESTNDETDAVETETAVCLHQQGGHLGHTNQAKEDIRRIQAENRKKNKEAREAREKLQQKELEAPEMPTETQPRTED